MTSLKSKMRERFVLWLEFSPSVDFFGEKTVCAGICSMNECVKLK